MSAWATILVALAGLTAIVDWLAVWRSLPGVEVVAKPGVMALLIGTVLSGSVDGVLLLAIGALAFSLVGDLLLLPAIDRFVPGLASFLIAHAFYLVAFLVDGQQPGLLVVGVLLTTLLAVGVGQPIIRGAAAKHNWLRTPVLVYVMALSAMAATGVGTGSPLVMAGGLIFAISDAILGWNRFVEPLRYGRLGTHVTYHLGQGLIVVGLIT
ncbi:MAG: lysoplasmalogenase [Acidimicrobiales bacterium]